MPTMVKAGASHHYWFFRPSPVVHLDRSHADLGRAAQQRQPTNNGAEKAPTITQIFLETGVSYDDDGYGVW